MGVYTLGLLQGLAVAAQGHEVQLLGYGDPPEGLPGAFPWHRIPLLPAGKASLWLSHQVALPWLARRLRLDVLHVPGVNVRLSQPGVPFLTPCPLVVTVHDAIPATFYGRQGPALPWRLRWSYRAALRAVQRASHIITVSETSLRDIRAALPLGSVPVSVVHNGLPPALDLAPRERDALLAGLGIAPPYLLYVGSYEPRKNVVGTIAAYERAAASAALPPLVLVVEADSGHKRQVLQTAGGSGVGDRLIWRHSVSDHELAALYLGAQLFVYPSLYEGFGFTPLQALSYGVPTVAGNAGAAPEVLGDAALLVDPTDTEALAAALVQLATSPDLRAEYARRGPQRAAHFTWERAAQQTLEAYALAAGRAASAEVAL